MRKREIESEIVKYFSEAKPENAALLFMIVRGIVEQRGLLKRKVGKVTKAAAASQRTE